jgi:FMN phosphatase YigB (HAD superfamily)
MKKLIIFDLDETLIHCQREELVTTENEEEDEDSFVPEINIYIKTPDSEEEEVKTSFTIRPYAMNCLKAAS